MKKLSQLHLWALDRQAIRASPTVAQQYDRMRPLTAEFIRETAPDRESIRDLLPLVAP